MMNGGGKTVLVVDDDADLSTLVATVLTEEGYAVETAANGQEALDSVARQMPDLIILDMKMPVMDGPQFASVFHTRYDNIAPIVILTASADARMRAEDVGARDWVGKPFDIDLLVQTVERNLPN